jgi:hypothetical protein
MGYPLVQAFPATISDAASSGSHGQARWASSRIAIRRLRQYPETGHGGANPSPQ